jgi:hypothetical protein
MMERNLSNLAVLDAAESRSINAENPTGEKGKGGTAASILGKSRKGKAFLDLEPGTETTMADINGPGVIHHIWITVQDSSPAGEFVLRDLILRMYWDDNENPAVETPLGDFFCCGFSAKCLVNSMPIVVAPYGGFNSFFPMPFRKHARITIENQHGGLIHAFFYTVNYTLEPVPGDTAYFYAQWRRTKYAKLGEDYVIADNIRGKGHYVGTYFAWTALERYWWGEGEIKFYIDGDKEYPTICGTGVEDYVGGAWGFYEKDQYGNISREETTYNTPFMGYPYHSVTSGTVPIYGYDAVPAHGLYRWHIMDPIRFTEDLKVTIQQIGHNGDHLFERADDIASVAYWYQNGKAQPFPEFPPREERLPR